MIQERLTAVIGALLFWGGVSTMVTAAPVGVVTDVQGRAVYTQAGARDVAMLNEIQSGARVQLAEQARLVVLYFDSGTQFALRGPAVVHFKPTGPEAVSGPTPERVAALAPGKDVRLKPGGLARAAYVMMAASSSIELLTVADTRTLETHPEFRWAAVEPAQSYDVKIATAGGEVVHTATTKSTSMTLPTDVALLTGTTYIWEVSALFGDGGRATAAAEFSIASADVRHEVESARPADDAALAEVVAFALWLEQMELKDEARRYWDIARAQRPNEPRLGALGSASLSMAVQ